MASTACKPFTLVSQMRVTLSASNDASFAFASLKPCRTVSLEPWVPDVQRSTFNDLIWLFSAKVSLWHSESDLLISATWTEEAIAIQRLRRCLIKNEIAFLSCLSVFQRGFHGQACMDMAGRWLVGMGSRNP